MKKFVFILIILVILGAGGFFFWQSRRKVIPLQVLKPISNMEIKSPAFSNNSLVPQKYTCDGENINPSLLISGVSSEAQSLVLIVDDPDAPMGTFTHWIVWNINPKINEIQENSLPQGAIEGRTDFGRTGYGGPCPPSGTHRYFFKLYSLNQKLDLSSGAKRSLLEKAMEGHILEKAELIGLYSRR